VGATPCAILQVSLPAGTYVGYNANPWLSECWLLNLTGASQTFTVRIRNKSSSLRSYDTHLVIALNDAGYNKLLSLVINGTTVPKSAFKNGTPRPYNLWNWPSGDVYPTYFNDNCINVGLISKNKYKDLSVSVSFSDASGVAMHFDAYGCRSYPPPNDGYITHNSISEDSTVILQSGLPPPQPPIADFSFNPLYPETNQITTFNASSSYDPDGYITSYAWDFGDGTPVVVESDPITTHTYTNYGDFTVKLTVTDNSSLTDEKTSPLHVSQHPIASFTFSPPDPLIHEIVTFNASTSTPDGGTLVSYKWNFGDGNITTENDPIITHVYATYGTYTVTLNVTDSEGKWDTHSEIITVEKAPIADFWWSPYYPQRDESITFDASASTPDGGVIISYAWDFGDGTPIVVESDPIAAHTYSITGDYTVTLNVTDSEGRWDIESHIVHVVARRYFLEVNTDPAGIVTIPGEGWYDESTNVELTAPDPVVVSAGVRYKFSYWDVDGTPKSGNPITVLMNTNHTATAHYILQYYLTVSSPYGIAGGEDWYNSGTTAYATLNIGIVDHGNGTRRVFTNWSGDASGTNYSQSDPIIMDAPKTAIANWKTQHAVTFTQIGSAVAPTVTYTADTDPTETVPFTVWVNAGSEITYAYQSIVEGAPGVRYVFTGVTPVSPQTVNGPFTVSGTYQVQYYLTVNTNPAEVLTLNPAAVSGEGWYNSGYTATVDAVQNVDKVAGASRYDFRSWTGATPTGVGNQATVLMDGPKTATANYQLQYKITFAQSGVGSDFTGTVVIIDAANYDRNTVSFWWDSGSLHTFAFQSPLVVTVNVKQYVWTSTTGLSTLQSGSITVSSSGSVTGNYKTQYYFSVSSPSGYGSPTPTSGWFDASSSITASVTSPWAGPTGTRYICTGWTGTGNVPPAGSGTSVTFTITQSSSITWNWITQYYLTVRTDPSGIVTIPGEGWYNSSKSVSLSAPSVSGYTFLNWDVDGANQGSGVSSITVSMNAPHTATAHYAAVSPPPQVPVGGYSISLVKQTPMSTMAIYAMLMALFGASLSFTKRKRK